MQQVNVVLADNHKIFLEGLSSVLCENNDLKFNIIDRVVSGLELLKILEKHPVDLLIMELNLLTLDGLEVLKKIKEQNLATKKMILSRYDNPKIVKEAFKAGADGYVLKSSDTSELLHGIRELLANKSFIGAKVQLSQAKEKPAPEGTHSMPFSDNFIKKYSLTKREIQILQLIIQAHNNKQIAKKLFISDQTVSVHRKNIMRKLSVSNTAGLIKAAYENFIVK